MLLVVAPFIQPVLLSRRLESVNCAASLLLCLVHDNDAVQCLDSKSDGVEELQSYDQAKFFGSLTALGSLTSASGVEYELVWLT